MHQFGLYRLWVAIIIYKLCEGWELYYRLDVDRCYNIYGVSDRWSETDRLFNVNTMYITKNAESSIKRFKSSLHGRRYDAIVVGGGSETYMIIINVF